MEAVPPHALVVIGARQRKGVVDKRMAAMESGVETGDLRRRREGLHRRLDAGDVVRLVERRKRDEPLSFAIVASSISFGSTRSGPPCTTRWPTAATGSHHGQPACSQSRMARMAASMVDAAPRIERIRAFFARGRFDLVPWRRRRRALDLARGQDLQLAPSAKWNAANLSDDEPAFKVRITETKFVTPPPWRPSLDRQTRGLRAASIRIAAPARRTRAGRDHCRPGSSASPALGPEHQSRASARATKVSSLASMFPASRLGTISTFGAAGAQVVLRRFHAPVTPAAVRLSRRSDHIPAPGDCATHKPRCRQ